MGNTGSWTVKLLPGQGFNEYLPRILLIDEGIKMQLKSAFHKRIVEWQNSYYQLRRSLQVTFALKWTHCARGECFIDKRTRTLKYRSDKVKQ